MAMNAKYDISYSWQQFVQATLTRRQQLLGKPTVRAAAGIAAIAGAGVLAVFAQLQDLAAVAVVCAATAAMQTYLWPAAAPWGCRCIVTVTGGLPPRVNRFLDDAYDRGVLRATPEGFQIRHAAIADYITSRVLRIELQTRRDAGDAKAGERLIRVMAYLGFTEQLPAEWTARILAYQGQVPELMERAAHGDEAALDQYAEILAFSGRAEDLKQLTNNPASGESGRLVRILGHLGAESELRSLAGRGSWQARRRLLDLLTNRGDLAGLAELAQGATADDEPPPKGSSTLAEEAERRLCDVLAHSGNRAELDRLAREGSGYAARRLLAEEAERRLCDVLAHSGNRAELDRLAREGSGYAARRLLTLLVHQQDIEGLRAIANANAYPGLQLAVPEPSVNDTLFNDLLQTWVDKHGESTLPFTLSKQASPTNYAAIRLDRLLADAEEGWEPQSLSFAGHGDNDREESLRDWHVVEALTNRGDLDGLKDLARRGVYPAQDALVNALADRGDLNRLRDLGRTAQHGNDRLGREAKSMYETILIARSATAELFAVAQDDLKYGSDVWEYFADRGDLQSLRQLALQPFALEAESQFSEFLLDTGQIAELEKYVDDVRRTKTYSAAARELAKALAAMGELPRLLQRAENDDDAAERCYFNVLAELGRLDELRDRADVSSAADLHYAQTLVVLGRFSELRARVNGGSSSASSVLEFVIMQDETDKMKSFYSTGDPLNGADTLLTLFPRIRQMSLRREDGVQGDDWPLRKLLYLAGRHDELRELISSPL